MRQSVVIYGCAGCIEIIEHLTREFRAKSPDRCSRTCPRCLIEHIVQVDRFGSEQPSPPPSPQDQNKSLGSNRGGEGGGVQFNKCAECGGDIPLVETYSVGDMPGFFHKGCGRVAWARFQAGRDTKVGQLPSERYRVLDAELRTKVKAPSVALPSLEMLSLLELLDERLGRAP